MRVGAERLARSRCTRGCARPPARARPRPDATGCRTCTSAPGPSLVLEGVRVHGAEGEPARGGVLLQHAARRRACPRGCAARPRASTRTSDCTVAQSSSFSNTSRGSPGPGKRAKRVPPVPRPQEGSATRSDCARASSALDVDAAPPELAAQVLEVRLEVAQQCAAVLGHEARFDGEGCHVRSFLVIADRPRARRRRRSGCCRSACWCGRTRRSRSPPPRPRA